MRLSTILADRKRLEIPIGEDVLNIVYRPNAITPETTSALSNLAKRVGELLGNEENQDNPLIGIQAIEVGAEMSNINVQQVLSYVVEWDLLEDDGSPVALTVERISELPQKFLETVVQAITKDNRPNPTKSKPSRVTSSMAAN